MCVNDGCIGLCVHRRWPIERHRKSIDFGRERGCVSPYLATLHTPARVQTRVEFVGLACDMSSNCTRSHWDYRLEREQAACTRGTTIVSTGYQGTTRVCYVCRSTKTQTSERSDEVSSYLMVAGHYISMYIEVTEDHLYNTQNSERSDEVSPHLMVAGVKGMYI